MGMAGRGTGLRARIFWGHMEAHNKCYYVVFQTVRSVLLGGIIGAGTAGP